MHQEAADGAWGTGHSSSVCFVPPRGQRDWPQHGEVHSSPGSPLLTRSLGKLWIPFYAEASSRRVRWSIRWIVFIYILNQQKVDKFKGRILVRMENPPQSWRTWTLHFKEEVFSCSRPADGSIAKAKKPGLFIPGTSFKGSSSSKEKNILFILVCWAGVRWGGGSRPSSGYILISIA